MAKTAVRAPAQSAPRPSGNVYMQGIAVPESAVMPNEFFARTRRHTLTEKTVFSNATGTDNIELRKSDIIASLMVCVQGNVVVTGGTTNVSRRWPWDLISAQFAANSATNLINVSGGKLKARELAKKVDLTDRSIAQSIGGATVTNGTMALSSDNWGGIGSGQTALAAGTYGFELWWEVPVAESDVDLLGAVFLASSTADLTCKISYLPIAQLFYGGTATNVAFSNVSTTVISKKFSIPSLNGQIIVPDLSNFHSMIQSQTGSIINGDNEIRLVGQGGAKNLLRAYYQLWNGAGNTSAPLVMNAANFGQQLWRYGNNETPDTFRDGDHMRVAVERNYDSDLGGPWGYGFHEFSSEFEFRDVVDMGATADLRILANVQPTVTLNSPVLEYVTETVFPAGQAA